MKHRNEIRRGSTPLSILLLSGIMLTATGCDDLLTVQDLDVTTEESFVDETALPSLYASAVDEYIDQYEDVILYSGLLADEWIASGTFPTRVEVDARDIDPTNATVEGIFSGLSRARALSDFVDQRIETIDTEGDFTAERAEVNALGGLAIVHMTQMYCEGTPMSQFNFQTNEVTYGPPLTRDAVYDSARVRFDDALSFASAGSDGEYLALIGEARILLNEGDYAGAAAQVAGIPTEWIYIADHDNQPGQNNPIWDLNFNQERWSAANLEGGNGLPFRDATDPRMLWNRTGSDVGFDRSTPQYNALKYPDRPAETVIADGVEARLIEAEAALWDGDPDGMVDILNELRQNVETLMPPRNFNYVTLIDAVGFPTTLPDLTVPGTLEEQVDLLFQERAYWLWLQGQRLNDLQRLIRNYGRDSEAVFPSGAYFKGGAYGPDVNFPIPAPELNNPSQGAGQCLNRDA